MTHDNILYELSKKFALRIINLYKFLTSDNQEYVMSKQIYRSGTSIGANIAESMNAQSRADFANKLSILLKEATETKYWLELLHESDYINEQQFSSIVNDLNIIIGTLINTLKKTRTMKRLISYLSFFHSFIFSFLHFFIFICCTNLNRC